MSEKEFRPVSERVENNVKGLFLALISIVIAINVGKVARTLAFVPFYLFGTANYLLILFTLFLGVYRIVKQKKFVFKHKIYYAGVILLVFTMMFITCYASFKANGLSFQNASLKEMMERYNGQLGTYYSTKFINFFSGESLWPFGLFGVLFTGLIANDAIILFIGIILFTIAALCFVSPFIFTKHDKRSKEERRQERENARKILAEQYAEEKDNNPIISHEPAFNLNPQPQVEEKEIEREAPEAGYESDPEPFINENSGFNQVSASLDNAFSSGKIQQNRMNEYTEFTPLVFSNDNTPFGRFQNQQPQVVATPVVEANPQPAPQKVEPVYDTEGPEFIEEEEEVNLIDSRPLVEEKAEEEHQVDESLVRIQPQFQEIPEMQSSPVNNQQLFEEPVQEVKKKRERVVWIPPSSDLLMTYETEAARELNEKAAAERIIVINKILENFKVGARCVGYTIGPSVTRFKIEYDANVTLKSVERLTDDISMRLGGVASRFAAIIPGELYSGFEVPNATITTVSFKDVYTALPDVKKHPLAVAFGKDISGNVIYADFNEFPHLLVAGTTGSGKSIFVHSIISTLIMRVSPDDLKIVLVDPKKVEMTKYRDMPHLLCPIITEAEKAKVCLQKLVVEMERRYELLALDPEISDIKGYNAKAKENGEETLPYIVAILDEYADLVDSCKEISQPVVSIAQKARSAGIHLLIATQRPSTNIITGVIKGNLPTRVALATSSYTDSMTIIGEGGAETLLGKGDMLVQSPLISRTGVTRLQGCYVQNKEIVHIVNYLKEHYETHFEEEFLDLVDHSKEPATNVLAPGEVEKESSAEEENKYQSIKQWVMTQEFVSMSKIQRECSVGFNRAGRFFSRLQKEGVVATTQDGSSKGCRVLVHDNYDVDTMVTSDELIG